MRRVALALFVLIAAGMFAPNARAQAPGTISYQGVLTDAAGSLVPDGNYSLTFKIYDDAVGGAATFTQTLPTVAVQRGGFSVELGGAGIPLSFDHAMFLGVSVGADPELTPRVVLTSSPYALGLRLPFSQKALSNTSPLFDLRNSGTGADARFQKRLDVGSIASSGSVQVFRGTTGVRVVDLHAIGGGGSLNIFDDVGNFIVDVQADANGAGGYAFITRNNFNAGFVVDGNSGGTSEPEVSINGSARSADFDMSVAGDASVALPVDAISATEILDEVGVASINGTLTTAMDGTTQTILSRTITCPGAGWCLVIGSMEVDATHTTGTSSSATFGVSANATAFPLTQDVPVTIPSGAATGTYGLPVTVHGVFTVSAGATTFYLLGREDTGSFSFADRQLSVVFIPTAYGTVTSSLLSPASDDAVLGVPLTPDDVVAEQQGAAREHQTRIDRELAAMRDQVSALEQKLKRVADEQSRAARGADR